MRAAQTLFFTGRCLRRSAVCAAVWLMLAGLHARAQNNFGSVNIGANATNSVSITFPAAAKVSSISVVSQGATGLDFVSGGAGTCAVATNYEAGQTCTVQVIFKPVYAGERYGAALLLDGSGNLITSAWLEGNGIGPQIAFGPGTIAAIDLMVNGVAFNNPFGVAVDGKGDLFVADSNNSRVVEIPVDGGAPIVIGPTVNGTGLSNPGGVAVDGAGDLFISDLDLNIVVEIPVTGGSPIVLNPVVNGIGLRYPCGMAIDGAGDLYIADVDNSRVIEIPGGGGAAVAIDPLVDGEKLSYPVTLALDSAGDLFVADLFANRVVEVPVGGGMPTAIDPSVNGQGLNFPYGIAIDAAGDLYIADANNRVIAVPPNGGAPMVLTPSVNGMGLNDPIGIALSAAGDLYIADSLNKRVVQVVRSQPPSINFAAAAPGSVSSDSPKTIQAVNIGNAALSFPAPATGNNPAISANFTLASGGASACPLLTPGSSQPGSLAAGTTCLLPISFQPAAAGTQYGTLTLTDTSLNAPAPAYAMQTISLSGDAPAATLSATSLSFSSQQVQTASASQQATFTNSGSASLSISSVAVVGANASSFVFSNSCGSTLAAGASCQIQGHFVPSVAGPMTAAIAITDNAAGSPQSVALTGTGVYPTTVTVTPSASNITSAQPLSVTVTVSGVNGTATPTGSVAVTIGSYASAPAALSGGSATINIPAGSLATGTDNIVATYAPDSTSLVVYASASGASSVIVTAASTATAPAAITNAASAITATSATLAGAVNPNGADTHVIFLYSTNSTLNGASQTASQDAGSATGVSQVSASISALTSSTTYYYQVAAQNSVGAASGAIFSFTTQPTPYFSVLTGAPLSIAPGATSGNTSTISITPWYGFTGTVNLSCAIAPAAANDPPTCSVPASVAISGENAQKATLTITTAAGSALNKPNAPPLRSAGGVLLACIALLMAPAWRRRWLAMMVWLCLFAAIIGTGCGGGSSVATGGGGSGEGGGSSNPGTSAGTYTVTITGVSGSMTETGTVALTVQ